MEPHSNDKDVMIKKKQANIIDSAEILERLISQEKDLHAIIIGKASCYKKFIPHFARIIEPIKRL